MVSRFLWSSLVIAMRKGDYMKGTRPLDNDEIRRVSTSFTGMYEIRNRGLFMLGVSTGGRISELLSLQIGDVFQNGKPVTDLLFEKSIVKGGEVSRAVPVNRDGRLAIDELTSWHREHYGNIDESRPLFPSRHNSGTVPMHRQTAHDVLKKAFIAAGLNGKLATHSLRKSFAQRLYDKSGDIYLVQELLGHRNISTTQNYLGVNYADARAAVESIALITESDRSHLLSNSLKKIDDETLITEIRKRGYKVLDLRDDKANGEVVRIG